MLTINFKVDNSKSEQNVLSKMEIPIDFGLDQTSNIRDIPRKEGNDTSNFSVDIKANDNSNVVINYCHNPCQKSNSQVKMIANLQGPMEAKFGSK